jgi:hypothetical protein
MNLRVEEAQGNFVAFHSISSVILFRELNCELGNNEEIDNGLKPTP